MEITLLLRVQQLINQNHTIMDKKKVFGILGALALLASALMYAVGNNSSHLSELKDFWWMPAIPGLLLIILAGASKPKA